MDVKLEKEGGNGVWCWRIGGQSEEDVATLVDELEKIVRR